MSDYTEADIIIGQRRQIDALRGAIREINAEHERCKVTLRTLLRDHPAIALAASLPVAEVSAMITRALALLATPFSSYCDSTTLVWVESDHRHHPYSCVEDRGHAGDHRSGTVHWSDPSPQAPTYRPRLQVVPKAEP